MNLVKIPESSYDNYFDRSRFELTWKINLFMFIANLVLIPIFAFLSLEELIAMIYSSVLTVIYQIVLYVKRKYKLIAVIWIVNGVLSTGLSYLLIPTETHFLEIIFMMMVSVYAFFTLGRLAGFLASIGNLAFVAVYLTTKLNKDMLSFTPLTDIQIICTILMSAYGFSIIIYTMMEFYKLNTYAEDKYVETNSELEQKNKIVSERDKEKTIMLREIHHRVKNNLQVITSLLRLQVDEDDDPSSSDRFHEAIRRVGAMSLIHEKMYQSDFLKELDFGDYLKSLSDDLIDSYSITKSVEVDVNAVPIDLANKYFVPIALLCNELISNSLKYAFRNRESGHIQVELKKQKKGCYTLNYSDFGEWKDPENERTFGTELIESLVEQMNGKSTRTIDDKGTHYAFVLESLDD